MQKGVTRVIGSFISKSTLWLMVFVVASVGLELIYSGHPAYAGGQVTTRKITMSNSAPSATSVTYAVTFHPTGVTNIGGIVIDFCANDPVVGDTTCTYPTGLTMGSTPSASAPTGFSTSTGSWVTTNSCQGGAAGGQTQVFKYTNTTAQTPNGAGTAITFNITSGTNTSTNGAFYARIATFDTSANATTGYTCVGTARAAAPTGMQDYGGVALSTTQNVGVTSKVFETLSFCVFQTSCGTQAQLVMGDPNTGLNATTGYDNNTAKYTLATNAQSGLVVQMFGLTLCRAASLILANCPASPTTSANTITGIGTTAATTALGTEQFGMCVNAISGTTAVAPYNDAGTGNLCNTGIGTGTYSGTSKFGFDDTAATGTNSAGGSSVLTAASVVASASSQFAFLGNISTVTEAGIYTTTLNMVATGTF